MSDSLRLFLGVDGGQSSTTALIGDETGRVLGSSVSGPCNHVQSAQEGREKLRGVVNECVSAALAAAKLPAGSRFESACFGMSGGPEDKRQILDEVIPAGKLVVTHDAEIALSGAHAGEPGVIVIAGTGSIAFGRNAANRLARAGGWGYIYGDEGGAFDLVRQALRAALRQHEGWGRETALTQALLDETGAQNANDLLHRFYTADWPRARVATLAAIVDRAALAADSVADEILWTAGRELAALAGAVIGSLWPESTQGVAVSWIGGVFRSSLLLERFQAVLTATHSAVCHPPRFSPAAGALLDAYRAAGLHPELAGAPDLK